MNGERIPEELPAHDRSLSTSFWLMVVLQTVGSVDMPGSGERKMPAPRAYLATIVIWSVLQIAADAGFDRAARASAWLTVLVGIVFGPFGGKVANLFTKVADTLAPASAPGPPTNADWAALAGPGFTPLTPKPQTTRTGSPTRQVGQP